MIFVLYFFFFYAGALLFLYNIGWLDWLGLVRMEHGGEYWRVCLILIGLIG